MQLDYPQTKNGMYELSRDQMDDIATKILGKFAPDVLTYPQPVNIEHLAEESFCLNVENKILSIDNKVLGATAFADDCIVIIDLLIGPILTEINEGTVFINQGLLGMSERARRRFTLAHEVAHWVLHRSYHSPFNQRFHFRKEYQNFIACRATRVECANHDRNTVYGLEEWQADSLAASLLMPIELFKEIARIVFYEYFGSSIYSEIKYTHTLSEAIGKIAKVFMVSKKATEIRLKHLGFIERTNSGSFAF